MLNDRQLMDAIVGGVMLQIHKLENLDRDKILGLLRLGFQAQKLLNDGLDESNFDFQRAVEKVISIHGAGTSVNTHISFKSAQHEEWLGLKREKILNGMHWNAFRQYISRELSKEQVDEQDNSSDRILGLMEDPERSGEWHSRGLVIGDVQSGKTTNFIAVANKAIDVGYKVIIVLSGLHNNLRKQTQIRFEEGVSGWDTSVVNSGYCGVADPAPDWFRRICAAIAPPDFEGRQRGFPLK